jgi:hypothetical protein
MAMQHSMKLSPAAAREQPYRTGGPSIGAHTGFLQSATSAINQAYTWPGKTQRRSRGQKQPQTGKRQRETHTWPLGVTPQRAPAEPEQSEPVLAWNSHCAPNAMRAPPASNFTPAESQRLRRPDNETERKGQRGRRTSFGRGDDHSTAAGHRIPPCSVGSRPWRTHLAERWVCLRRAKSRAQGAIGYVLAG